MQNERIRTDVENLLLSEMVEDDEFFVNSTALDEAVDAIIPANTKPGLFDDADSEDDIVNGMDDPDVLDLLDDNDEIF